MEIEPDEAMWRLQRERNFWRTIAIALAVMVTLLMGIGSVVGLTLVFQNRQQAVRAEMAAVEERQQRLQAEQAAAAERDVRRFLEEQHKPITRPEAMKIAEEHLKVQGRRETDARQVDGEWHVTITRPGGFTTVVVDKQGKVVRVEPGKDKVHGQ